MSSDTYSYDANSNRIGHSGPNDTVDADYDEQDRMVRYGDSFYSYNEAGDLTEKSGPECVTTYDYDAAGNLRAVTLPDGTQIEYLIDGRDRRVGKKVNGRLEKTWIYRDQLSPVAQFDADGNMTHRFVYAEKAHVPSYMIRLDPASGAQTDYRVISDHLGSVRQVIDAETGAIVQEMDYGPFGQVLYDTNQGFQPFGFAGGVYDRDTGLVRFGARDYDPVTGRWTAKDPIDFAGGDVNLYGYVVDDPINVIDSEGLRGRNSINPREHPAYSPSPLLRWDTHEALERLPDFAREAALKEIRRGRQQDLRRGYTTDHYGFPVIPDPNHMECWWKFPNPLVCSENELSGISLHESGCWRECTRGPVFKY